MGKREAIPAACAFLLVLLLTPVSPKCRRGTVGECKAAEDVPGAEFAGATFDITTLTPQQNVFQWASQGAGCTLCENPLLPGKPLQVLPWRLAGWKAHVPCEQKVQQSVQSSPLAVAEALTKLQVTNDWRKGLDLKKTLGGKAQWALAGSRSGLTRDSMQNGRYDKYHFLLHQFSYSCYRFRLNASRPLSVGFQNHVNQLPEKYEPSAKFPYQQLIQKFGTHVGTELDVGAQFRHLSVVPVRKAGMHNVSVSELSRCLAMEAGVAFGFKGVTDSLDFQMCEEKKKNANFFRLLRDAVKVMSGRWFSFFTSHEEWLESAKSRPTMLSSALQPLHTLVADPRREGLRKAVSEYVQGKAGGDKCHRPCPPGYQPSASHFCFCECPNLDSNSPDCCQPKQGTARLVVTIQNAADLWGDLITPSDAYVSVAFQKRGMCTRTVWNDDRPRWDVAFDFGVVQLEEAFNKLLVDVWDEDFGWNDQRLGRCRKYLKASWDETRLQCILKHGHLNLRYTLTCAHGLYGPTCREDCFVPTYF